MKRYPMSFLDKPFRSQVLRQISISVSTFNSLFPHLSIEIKGVLAQALPHFLFCMILSMNESIPHFYTKETIFQLCTMFFSSLLHNFFCLLNSLPFFSHSFLIFFPFSFFLNACLLFVTYSHHLFLQRLLLVSHVFPSPFSS